MKGHNRRLLLFAGNLPVMFVLIVMFHQTNGCFGNDNGFKPQQVEWANTINIDTPV